MDIRDEVITSLDEQAIDAKQLAKYMLCWMSEQEAEDFLRRNDLMHLAPCNLLEEELIDEP